MRWDNIIRKLHNKRLYNEEVLLGVNYIIRKLYDKKITR